MRKTVSIMVPGETKPRTFHLEQAKAERFAADIRTKGGIAEIGPFKMEASLLEVLAKAGIDASKIR